MTSRDLPLLGRGGKFPSKYNYRYKAEFCCHEWEGQECWELPDIKSLLKTMLIRTKENFPAVSMRLILNKKQLQSTIKGGMGHGRKTQCDVGLVIHWKLRGEQEYQEESWSTLATTLNPTWHQYIARGMWKLRCIEVKVVSHNRI